MAVVLRVAHESIGILNFTDDEVPRVSTRHMQQADEQITQTNNLTVLYSGQVRFEFDIRFEVFFASTLEKLERVWNLQDEFTLWPWLRASPLSSFLCVWPAGVFREEHLFGLAAAQWDYEVTWKEATKGSCPEILRS